MTSKRLLLYFFDIESFFVDYGDTIEFSKDKIRFMMFIEKEIRDSKRISEDRIRPIVSIKTSGVL